LLVVARYPVERVQLHRQGKHSISASSMPTHRRTPAAAARLQPQRERSALTAATLGQHARKKE
jgi:hypothetical protein